MAHLKGGGLWAGSPYGPRRKRAKIVDASILLAPKAPKQKFGCQPQTLEGEGGGGSRGGGTPPPPAVYGRCNASLGLGVGVGAQGQGKRGGGALEFVEGKGMVLFSWAFLKQIFKPTPHRTGPWHVGLCDLVCGMG